MNLGRPMLRSLIAAVAATLFGLSPAGAQPPIHTPVQPVPAPDPQSLAVPARGGNNSNPNWWPSFLNAANQSSANAGPYWHRFYTIPFPGSGTLAGQAAFTGLRFANTSFTYVDPIVQPAGV